MASRVMDVLLNMNLGGWFAYTEVGLLPGTNRSSAAFTAPGQAGPRQRPKLGTRR